MTAFALSLKLKNLTEKKKENVPLWNVNWLKTLFACGGGRVDSVWLSKE